MYKRKSLLQKKIHMKNINQIIEINFSMQFNAHKRHKT